jgi:hypothetical protein
MKPAVKITLLLCAAVVAVVIGLRFYHQPRSHQDGSVAAVPAATPAASRLPAAPLAKSAPVSMSAAPAVVSEWLKPVLTPVPGRSFADRVKILRARTANLTDDEIKALYSYLLAPANSSDESRSGENWLRNVMLDRLTQQPELPAGLPVVLMSIYQDPQQDVVIRDYAIQHINPAYDRANTDDKAALNQTLWQAAGETDSSIAGTALLALNDLAQGNPELDQNQIAQTALKLAGNDSCGELVRITAVQLCGQMGVSQAAELIQQLARQAGSIPLRISAIAALGSLGDQDTETFLQEIAAGNEDRLKPAAETALKRLKQRLGT